MIGDWLAPLPIEGETLRFDLPDHRSLVARQLLQVRVRMTALAFGVGTTMVAANLEGAALVVDARGLAAANDAVRSGLEAGPFEGVRLLRSLRDARGAVEASARGGDLEAHVEAAAVLAALGSLKFALPDTLRPRLAALVGGAEVEPLLAPDGVSMWSVVRGRELALARRRSLGPAGRYRRLLAAHRESYGYLQGEDVDYRIFESLEAIDARVAGLGWEEERWRLAASLAADRAAKAGAREAFAVALAGSSSGEGIATLVSQVLLARALADHEDVNRRAKVRLLRDLSRVADARGLDITDAGLAELCAVPVVAA